MCWGSFCPAETDLKVLFRVNQDLTSAQPVWMVVHVLASPERPLQAVLVLEVGGEEEVENAPGAGKRQRNAERHRKLLILEPERRDSVLNNCDGGNKKYLLITTDAW